MRRAANVAASEAAQPQQAAAIAAAGPNATQKPAVIPQGMPPALVAAAVLPVPTFTAPAMRSLTILGRSGGASRQGVQFTAHTPLSIPAAVATEGGWPGGATAAAAAPGGEVADSEAGFGVEQIAQRRGLMAAETIPMGPWGPPAATLEHPPALKHPPAAQQPAAPAAAEAAAQAAALREAAVAAAAVAKAAAAAQLQPRQLQPRRLGVQERKAKHIPSNHAGRPRCPKGGEGGVRCEPQQPRPPSGGQSQEGCSAGHSSMICQTERMLGVILALDNHKRRRLESGKTAAGMATTSGKWLGKSIGAIHAVAACHSFEAH